MERDEESNDGFLLSASYHSLKPLVAGLSDCDLGMSPANCDQDLGMFPANCDQDLGMSPANCDQDLGMSPAN